MTNKGVLADIFRSLKGMEEKGIKVELVRRGPKKKEKAA
jgi:hypothetical protein